MNMTVLKQQIKQHQIAPVYLVEGDEVYLVDAAQKLFHNLLSPEEADMNFGQYDMQTEPLADALDDAASAPFFGEHRLIFIKQPIFLTADAKKAKVHHDIDGFLKYLANPLPSTILVIFAPYPKLDERKKVTKFLKKTATVVDAQKRTPEQAQHEVQRAFKQANVKLMPEALTILMQRTAGDLTAMMSAVPILLTYALQSQTITAEAITALVPQNLEQNVFSLVDAILAQQVTKALTIYDELLLQKEEPLKINAILVGQFRLLLQIKILQKSGYSQGSLAQVLKVHPYRIKLALRQTKRFSQANLSAAYLGLTDIEVQLKSSQQSSRLLFQMFLLKFTDRTVHPQQTLVNNRV